jgi:hypothetical protein
MFLLTVVVNNAAFGTDNFEITQEGVEKGIAAK